MKIALCGVPGIGKTKLSEAFLANWPMYELANRTGQTVPTSETRDNLVELEKILDDRVTEALFVTGKTNVIYDGCILDALAHLFLYVASHPEAEQSKLRKYVGLAHHGLTAYDIIFYLPFNTHYSGCNKDELPNEATVFATNLDNFFMAFHQQWKAGKPGVFPFETREGSPPMIDLFGSAQERLALLKMYIKSTGEAYGGDPKDSLLNVPGDLFDARGKKISMGTTK